MDLDLDNLRNGLNAVKDVFSLLKAAKDALPESMDKEALEKALVEVEKTAAIADAKIAKSFGYALCQCTFPPQIMLKEGTGDRYSLVCSACGDRGEHDHNPVTMLFDGGR